MNNLQIIHDVIDNLNLNTSFKENLEFRIKQFEQNQFNESGKKKSPYKQDFKQINLILYSFFLIYQIDHHCMQILRKTKYFIR